MNDIQLGTNWNNNGVKHRVTSADEQEITTWSEPVDDVGIGGYSWLGSPEAFRKEFVAA